MMITDDTIDNAQKRLQNLANGTCGLRPSSAPSCITIMKWIGGRITKYIAVLLINPSLIITSNGQMYPDLKSFMMTDLYPKYLQPFTITVTEDGKIHPKYGSFKRGAEFAAESYAKAMEANADKIRIITNLHDKNRFPMNFTDLVTMDEVSMKDFIINNYNVQRDKQNILIAFRATKQRVYESNISILQCSMWLDVLRNKRWPFISSICKGIDPRALNTALLNRITHTDDTIIVVEFSEDCSRWNISSLEEYLEMSQKQQSQSGGKKHRSRSEST